MLEISEEKHAPQLASKIQNISINQIHDYFLINRSQLQSNRLKFTDGLTDYTTAIILVTVRCFCHVVMIALR